MAKTANSEVAWRNASRARSTVSCLACKKRKQRCDRAKPCSNCISRHAEVHCVYETPKPTKRPRPKPETVGTWTVQPQSKQSSPGSDEWTYVAEHESPTESIQSGDAWEHVRIPTEPLHGSHEESGLHLPDILNEAHDVAADGELQALIRITSPTFPRQPGLGRTDPFDTLSVKGPMCDFLVQHMRNQSDPFFDTLPPSQFQYPFTKIWMPVAMKTEIGLLVTTYCAAVNFDNQRELEPQPYTVAAKSRLLNLLNEGLRSSKPFPDELIMAVYSLMYLVPSEDFEVHWKGLVTMVNVRGGLGEQGIDGIVGNLISIADLDFAALFESEPRLIRTLNNGSSAAFSPHINMHSPLHRLSQSCAAPDNLSDLPHRMADVLQRLQKVTSLVIDTFSTLADITSTINDECQHLLETIEDSQVDRFSNRREGLVYEALCIAARVYVRCISKVVKFSKGFPTAELQNLQDILSTLSRNAWDNVPGVLLFIYLVAQPAARLDPTFKTYFLVAQQRLAAPLALVMYKDTALSLEKFILVERYIRMAESARFARTVTLLCN